MDDETLNRFLNLCTAVIIVLFIAMIVALPFAMYCVDHAGGDR